MTLMCTCMTHRLRTCLRDKGATSATAIRLERPADLAAWVLRDNPGWTPARIQAAMNGDKTEQVNLTYPIPVLILYATVIVSEDGVVHFYDSYGHDAVVTRMTRTSNRPAGRASTGPRLPLSVLTYSAFVWWSLEPQRRSMVK